MQKPVEKPIKFIKNAATKGKSYPVAHIESIIDGSGKTLPEILKESGGVTETTYADLKNLRDNGKLSPGSLYRITDVTNAFSPDSPYYGKQVDVIVMATDNSTLSEEGWAAMHLTEPYTVTFVGDNVTKKMYIYREDNHIWYVETDTLQGGDMADLAADYGLEYDELVTVDEDNKTVSVSGSYNYFASNFYDENAKYNDFQDTNFGEWKIWYCLDNDKSRFAWADDSVDEDVPAKIQTNGSRGYTFPTNTTFIRDEQDDEIEEKSGKTFYAWVKDDDNSTIAYTNSNPPLVGEEHFLYIKGSRGFEEANGNTVDYYTPAHEGTGLPNGHGVIYAVEEGSWVNNSTGAIKIIEVEGNTPTQELAPNTFYKFTGNITSLTVTLGLAKEDELAIYAFCFTAGTNNPTINFPASVDADEVSILNGDYVEYSIMNNKAVGKTW